MTDEVSQTGIIPLTVTYLQMTERPKRPVPPCPVRNFALLHAKEPPVHFFRYLYHEVGKDWYWVEQKWYADDIIADYIRDEKVELHVPYVNGCPAGIMLLDFRTDGIGDLGYFGLIPDFVGLKLGGYLLEVAIDLLWSKGIETATVNTCTLDSPVALGLYQKKGFVPISRENKKYDLDNNQVIYEQ